MTTVTVSTQVAGPLEQVFRHFTDIEQAAKRVSGIRGIEMMTPGPFGPGTKWREIREVLGRLDSAEMQVTSRGGIAPVAPLAADVVAAVGRVIPIGEVVGSGGIGSGEMAVGTPALLGDSRRGEPE